MVDRFGRHPVSRRVSAKRAAPAAWQQQLALDAAPELSVENGQARKTAYLVTLSHPHNTHSQCGTLLRVPGSLSHAQVRDAMLDACAHPVAADTGNAVQGFTVELEYLVVYRERHSAGHGDVLHAHYHIAVKGPRFRFLHVKRALLQRHGLASHWSDTHEGYWSCVRYGYWPSPPHKPQDALDPEPLSWARVGQHPRLVDAMIEPTTAAAVARRREMAVRQAAIAGSSEPRPTEMDVWPLVVRFNIRNRSDNRSAHLALIQAAKARCTPEMVKFLFRIRAKLPTLIDDCWTWEEVDEQLAAASQSREECLVAALRQPCRCNGVWGARVAESLAANKIDPAVIGRDIYRSLVAGRSESTPVIVLAGRRGGEGKSLLLYPMPAVFGPSRIQSCPVKGSFPLLGVENKTVCILDEWHFAASVLPLNVQLLWYEGKPVPISLPQGNDVVGHLDYRGTAPIIATCPLKRIEQMEQAVRKADAEDTSSEASMLLRRLRIYRFTERMQKPPAHIPQCPCCFANFLFQAVSECSHAP